MGKAAMRPLQAADILAHCGLTYRDNFSQAVLNMISSNGGIRHDVMRLNEWHIGKLVESVAIQEESLAETRHEMHEMRRFLGNIGVTIQATPGGFLIDSMNAKEVVTDEDITQMLENDPGIRMSVPRKIQ
jgi:hypothetical protein